MIVSTLFPATENVLVSATTTPFFPGNSSMNMVAVFSIAPLSRISALVSVVLFRACSIRFIIILVAYDIVKIFFLCRALGGQFRENIETSASAYFDEAHLPPLAEEKNTKEQIAMCFQANRDDFWTAQFD